MNKIGTVKRVIQEKRFGFIRAEGRDEYFFHQQDFLGDWEQLVAACNDGTNREVKVEFTPINTDRGLRAQNVRWVESNGNVEEGKRRRNAGW